MGRDEEPAASGAPPSLVQRFLKGLSSESFWKSAGELNFWEQGCLGRSIATGFIVGTLAGVHRYRNVKLASKAIERGTMAFLFGLTINFFSCRQIMEEVARKHGPTVKLAPPAPKS